jgi:riboflavin kinase/FMN adenylyltransferase
MAVGNFDGVHLGHRRVIETAGAVARARDKPWSVLTFEPHPREVFRPNDPPFRLTPFRAKSRLIEELGVELLVTLHFDPAFAARSAEAFVRDVLVGGIGVDHVVVGHDFVFGHGRGGDVALLRAMGAELGYGVTVVDPVGRGDSVIYSSTSVRVALDRGDPREAAALLGRPWELEGRVDQGDQRGRTLGFPTANLALGSYLRPALGVYAVRALIEEGDGAGWYDGVANLGNRPTVGGADVRLETHLFDFAGDLYGRHLRVALIDRIRPEQRFDGLDALKAQIARDCEQARTILARTSLARTSLASLPTSPEIGDR